MKDMESRSSKKKGKGTPTIEFPTFSEAFFSHFLFAKRDRDRCVFTSITDVFLLWSISPWQFRGL